VRSKTHESNYFFIPSSFLFIFFDDTDVFDFRAERHAKFALLSVKYLLTEPSYVDMQILDEAGTVLAAPLDKAFRQSGLQQEVLNGRWSSVTPFIDARALEVSDAALAHAPPVASGRYTVRLTISATYSSYKYFEKTVESKVDF